MDEYTHKLNSSFRKALFEYIKDNPTHIHKGYTLTIDRIMNITPDANLKDLPQHILTSGIINTIDFQGTALINEKKENYVKQRNIEFWCKDCIVSFDEEEVAFDIEPIDDFILIDMSI